MLQKTNQYRLKRKATTFLATAVIAGATLGLTSPAHAVPEFVPLGSFGFSAFFLSEAFDVSADGTTVAGTAAGAGTRAFRWTDAGGLENLGALAGATISQGQAISADGSVVVGSSTTGGMAEAFRWTAATGMVGLGDLPGGAASSSASAVNADGSVIAGTSSSDDGAEAYRWTQATGMVPLGGLGATPYNSGVFDMSADGSVLVGLSTNAAFQQEAFRWTAATGMVGLGDLPGTHFSSVANGVSDDGSVVVGMGKRSPSSNEAFRWTSASGLVGLGFLAGGVDFSEALDVSADGSVAVGWASSAAGIEAMIWDEINGMRSVQDLLAAAVPTGWVLSKAHAISVDGLAIVGKGTNPDGKVEGWFARLDAAPAVPVPATLPLFAAVLAGLSFAVRRRP